MTGRTDKSRIEARLVEVRRLLAERHARIQPDAGFAGRVVARLPRNEAWSVEWAARRVLPASLACPMVLLIAVLPTGGSARPTPAPAPPCRSSPPPRPPPTWPLRG